MWKQKWWMLTVASQVSEKILKNTSTQRWGKWRHHNFFELFSVVDWPKLLLFSKSAKS